MSMPSGIGSTGMSAVLQVEGADGKDQTKISPGKQHTPEASKRRPAALVPFDTTTPTATSTPPPSCGTGANYTYTSSQGASIEPGTSLVPGTQCDQCTATIPLPFTYYFYGQPYTSAIVGDNGTLAFVANGNGFSNLCIPRVSFNDAIMAHWDDLDMSNAASGHGIYVSTTGTAPNRRFNRIDLWCARQHRKQRYYRHATGYRQPVNAVCLQHSEQPLFRAKA
jgi:hypothetical protein